jgi:hypothetical protein
MFVYFGAEADAFDPSALIGDGGVVDLVGL